MQGYSRLKPALIWPDPPKFPAVAVFPGRGVTVIFIFFSRNNPVKFTDPDGKELLLTRSINREEAALVKRILGVGAFFRNIKINIFDNLSQGRSASLPGGNILLDKVVTPTTATAANKGVFMHEFYHQIQYIKAPLTAWNQLEDELAIDFTGMDDPYSYGSYIATDLSRYNRITDIPYLEGQAQLVEDFTVLFEKKYNGEYITKRKHRHEGTGSYFI
jgi:hypothetical protein